MRFFIVLLTLSMIMTMTMIMSMTMDGMDGEEMIEKTSDECDVIE